MASKCTASDCLYFATASTPFCSEHSGLELRVLDDHKEIQAMVQKLDKCTPLCPFPFRKFRATYKKAQALSSNFSSLDLQQAAEALGLDNSLTFMGEGQADLLSDAINNNDALDSGTKHTLDTVVASCVLRPWKLKVARTKLCYEQPQSKVALQRHVSQTIAGRAYIAPPAL